MSKKKKHKKQKPADDFIIQVDQSLDRKYLDLIEEVQFMQADLKRAERKNKKKQKKKLSKGGCFYDTSTGGLEARRQLIYQMEGTNFFERAANILNELQPVCAVIAKLVMSLIVAILSIDVVKYTIKPATLHKIQNIYGLARTVSGQLA